MVVADMADLLRVVACCGKYGAARRSVLIENKLDATRPDRNLLADVLPDSWRKVGEFPA
jgi:hypothetical protein